MFSKLKQIFQIGKAKKTENNDAPKRFNDAVLIVRQDNDLKKLPVEASNYMALRLLGCETNDLVERDLRDFLPDNVNEIIDDNIEFTDDGKSIDGVLNRVPNFKIRAKDGSEIPLRIRVIRSLSSSASPRFQIIMNDSSFTESLEAFRSNYRQNMHGNEVFDDKTGLISRESVIKDLELISYYTERNQKESCYAIFKFINYDDLRIEHEDEGAHRMLSSLIEVINNTKRTQDITGLIEPGAVILIFPETPKENMKIPLNRIHSKLPPEIKSELRVFYNTIKAGVTPEEQLSACMKGMAGTL